MFVQTVLYVFQIKSQFVRLWCCHCEATLGTLRVLQPTWCLAFCGLREGRPSHLTPHLGKLEFLLLLLKIDKKRTNVLHYLVSRMKSSVVVNENLSPVLDGTLLVT